MASGYIAIILGMQWGDEGKGKIVHHKGTVDGNFDLFARFQGGNNAGHTVKIHDSVFKLNYIPSGAVTGATALLGHDMVIHPPYLIEKEIKMLEKKSSWKSEDSLIVSDRAHVTLDQHIVEDGLIRINQGKFSALSTLRGISPAYADKHLRFGIRFADLLDRSILRERLEKMFDHKRPLFDSITPEGREAVKKSLKDMYGDDGVEIFENGIELDAKAVANRYHEFGVQLESNISDATVEVHKEYDAGGRIIIEGAQALKLDVTLGASPFGTSSHITPGAACAGVGINHKMVDKVIGVVKVMSSRVGGGPLPTELYTDPELGMTLKDQEALAHKCGEYGTTTGRMRRLLWVDGVDLRYAAKVCGVDEIALTKLDQIPFFEDYTDHVKIGTAYTDTKGNRYTNAPPANWSSLEGCKVEYEKFPLWKNLDKQEWMGIVETKQLPTEIEPYVKRIAQLMNVKKTILSVGPDASETFSYSIKN